MFALRAASGWQRCRDGQRVLQACQCFEHIAGLGVISGATLPFALLTQLALAGRGAQGVAARSCTAAARRLCMAHMAGVRLAVHGASDATLRAWRRCGALCTRYSWGGGGRFTAHRLSAALLRCRGSLGQPIWSASSSQRFEVQQGSCIITKTSLMVTVHTDLFGLHWGCDALTRKLTAFSVHLPPPLLPLAAAPCCCTALHACSSQAPATEADLFVARATMQVCSCSFHASLVSPVRSCLH